MNTKRKLLGIMILSYIVLISLIITIGLSIHQREQEFTSTTTVTKIDENQIEVIETAIPMISTPTPTISTLIPTQIPPSIEPSMTQTFITPSVSPTRPQETPTPSQPTSTLPGYPISSDETKTTTATTQSYPDNISTLSTQTSTTTAISYGGWGGEWWVYSEQPNGSFLSGLMSVNIDGSDFSATVSFGEQQYFFDGILNESQVIVIGSWFGSGGSGNFYWRINALEQFVGNLDRELGFCGARTENNWPDPCLGAPSNK